MNTKNKEAKFVVNPLIRYFRSHRRSGATWEKIYRPKFETSATGWDLQVERKNQVLLIEAKYLQGSAASALAGLLVAPLTKREERMKSGKKKSWSSVVCWAIGCGYDRAGRDRKYEMGGVYQILFDFFARNPKFWRYYSKTLKVKYIYFVDKQKKRKNVGKISFEKMLNLASQYKASFDKPSLDKRRRKAEELLKVTFN